MASEIGHDARARLRGAALELFGERGYNRTTAAEIAARAGVTERTFFRYFPDKREVLFEGEATLSAALTALIEGAPSELAPLETLLHAFHSVAPMLEGNRPYAKPRQALIAATPAIHERELAKLAALSTTLVDALKARGATSLRATLAAQAGVAAFVRATVSWLDDPEPSLAERIGITFYELRAVLAGRTS